MIPTKKEIEVALNTINDLAIFAANHNCFTEVPELIKITEWLKEQAQKAALLEKYPPFFQITSQIPEDSQIPEVVKKQHNKLIDTYVDIVDEIGSDTAK